MSLDALLGREADARAFAEFLEVRHPFGAHLARYLGLFRPPKRRLSMARAIALWAELAPDIQRGAIKRKGRDWAVPAEAWQAAIEQMLSARDRGTLTLPLTSHGYLYEVLCAMADKAEATAERDAEADRAASARARGRGEGAQSVSDAIATAGPSLAALAARDRLRALREPRQQPDGTEASG